MDKPYSGPEPIAPGSNTHTSKESSSSWAASRWPRYHPRPAVDPRVFPRRFQTCQLDVELGQAGCRGFQPFWRLRRWIRNDVFDANPRYVSDATKSGVTAPNLFEVLRKGAESARKSPGAGPTSEKRRNGRPSAPAPEERRFGDGTRRPATRNRAVRAVAYPVTDTGKSAEKARSSRAPQPPVCSDAGTSSDVPATSLAALLNPAAKPALEDIFEAHFQVRPRVVTNLRLG
jgi:hypothetical protein